MTGGERWLDLLCRTIEPDMSKAERRRRSVVVALGTEVLSLVGSLSAL